MNILRVTEIGFHARLIYLVILSATINHQINPGATSSSYIFDAYIIFLMSIMMFFCKFDTIRIFKVTFMFAIFLFFNFYHYVVESYYLSGYDFARACRPYLYLYFLIIISCLIHKGDLHTSNTFNFESLTIKIILFFVVGYVFKLYLGDFRPDLYAENNFEIPALIILFFLTARSTYTRSILLGFVSIISFSKSGILSYAFSMFRLYRRSFFSYIAVFMVSLVVIGFVFAYRGVDTIENIDRFKFLNIFWESFTSTGYFNMLLGNGIGSQLPYTYCLDMGFFLEKFYSNQIYCDSSVFHSFIMKLIYDAGFIGFLVYLGLFYRMLSNFLTGNERSSVMGILIISSLSISGFASPLIVWPIFFIAAIRKVTASQ